MAKPNPDDIVGVWETKGKFGRAHVEVFERDGKYHGKIVWLENPNDEKTGQPRVDERGRPYLGMEVLNNMEFDGRYKWENGTAYDPDNGKTYKGNIRLPDADKMKLRGYIGVSAIGRTETWKRVQTA